VPASQYNPFPHRCTHDRSRQILLLQYLFFAVKQNIYRCLNCINNRTVKQGHQPDFFLWVERLLRNNHQIIITEPILFAPCAGAEQQDMCARYVIRNRFADRFIDGWSVHLSNICIRNEIETLPSFIVLLEEETRSGRSLVGLAGSDRLFQT